MGFSSSSLLNTCFIGILRVLCYSNATLGHYIIENNKPIMTVDDFLSLTWDYNVDSCWIMCTEVQFLKNIKLPPAI